MKNEMETALFNIVILLVGVAIGYYIAKRSDEQMFEEGLQAGVEMVMPHLDESRKTNHELVEVIKNVTNRNTIH